MLCLCRTVSSDKLCVKFLRLFATDDYKTVDLPNVDS